jgi:rhodanese-related sulfurtransferase
MKFLKNLGIIRVKKKNLILFLIPFLLLISITAGCSVQKTKLKKVQKFKNLSSEELFEMLKDKDFFLLDVHIPEQRHIQGTDEFIPYNEIEKYKENLPAEKSEKIVVYCRSGRMSEIAARELVKMGYENVYNLEGGTIEWKKKGYPFE